MSTDDELFRSRRVGKMVRDARADVGLSQAELLTAMGKGAGYRMWIRELESGVRERTGEATVLTVEEYDKLAGLLNIDVVDLLRAAGVPKTEWTDLSNSSSNSASVVRIDATGLSDRQVRVVEELVRELRKVPDDDTEAGGR
ncbi:XRE family transcriptional regulator [Corynebacterium sp. USCH3]|uniref:XRE family transcriptional regulator n=1 Tax=Corynebacterium sp. USCH3 TaxID=3024840 RepID=UPI00309B0263